MEYLDGTVLFYGALILSAAAATAVWSPIQIVLDRRQWRAKHGARPPSSTARATRAAHWERTWRAGMIAAAVLVWPAVTEAAQTALGRI